MKNILYLILIICILINSYSIAYANNQSAQDIKMLINKLFISIEKNNLKEYLSYFSKNYYHQSKNEHEQKIIEEYDDLKGRFPYNNDISEIKIKEGDIKIKVMEEKAICTTELEIYTKYKNGLDYTKQDKVIYTLTKNENNQWLIININ